MSDKPLSESQIKQWEILQMIRKTQNSFEKRSKDYSEMGDAGINKPTCKKVSQAYQNCANDLNLILAVIESIH